MDVLDDLTYIFMFIPSLDRYMECFSDNDGMFRVLMELSM